MKVLLTGATGFVGREALRQLLAAGHGVRAVVRDPTRAPQDSSSAQGTDTPRRLIDAVYGNVLQPESLRGAAEGCDAVIHLVGIISEISEQTFENVHLNATNNVLAEAKRARVKRWIQMSALGTRPNAVSRYHQTKWSAEESVRASGLDWTVLRPSLIYGPEDHFVNLFAGMAHWTPVLPVMGNGESLLQPVSVENVCRCFVGALAEPRSISQTMDVCGPDRLTFNQVLEAILNAMGKRRLKVHLPLSLGRIQAALLETIFPILLRKAAPLNRDQLLMLQEDNVGDARPAEEMFNLTQARFAEDIRRYLQQKAPCKQISQRAD